MVIGYAILAAIVIVVAAVTGGDLLRRDPDRGRVLRRGDRLELVAASATREAAKSNDAERATGTRRRRWRRSAATSRTIRAPRGTTLNARSWSTEAPLRMLLNNLDREVAERPEELVVYGGSGKAARDHDVAAGDRPRRCSTLGDDETLLVQSGKPVGVLPDAARARRAC